MSRVQIFIMSLSTFISRRAINKLQNRQFYFFSMWAVMGESVNTQFTNTMVPVGVVEEGSGEGELESEVAISVLW
jgi:hypothetical protein